MPTLDFYEDSEKEARIQFKKNHPSKILDKLVPVGSSGRKSNYTYPSRNRVLFRATWHWKKQTNKYKF